MSACLKSGSWAPLELVKSTEKKKERRKKVCVNIGQLNLQTPQVWCTQAVWTNCSPYIIIYKSLSNTKSTRKVFSSIYFGPGGLRAPCVLACAMRSLAIVITNFRSLFLLFFFFFFSPSFAFDPLRGISHV